MSLLSRAGARSPTALKELEPRERELEAQLRELWLLVPNIPDASVPEGAGEEDNVEVTPRGRAAASSTSSRSTT